MHTRREHLKYFHTGSGRPEAVCVVTAICYFGLYCVVALTLLFCQPFGNPPDEYNRYLIPQFIAENGTLPTGFEEEVRIEGYGSSYAFHPILPYIFQGYLMRLAGLFTQDSQALLLTARLVNFLFVLLLGHLWFQDRRFAWLFAFLVTFWPQGIFLHTYVNTDSCCMMSIAMILYGLTWGLQKGFGPAASILLSLGIILCALSYYNAYGFILSSILLFTASFLSWEKGRRPVFQWKPFLKTGGMISLVVLLGIGWWFIRNLLLYEGDLLGMAARERFATLHALPQYQPALRASWLNLGYSAWDMLRDSDFITLTRQSFICSYGAMNITTSIWIYRFYRVLVAVGVLCSLLIPLRYTWKVSGILERKERVCRESRTKTQAGMGAGKGLTRFFHGNMVFCIAMPYLLSVIFSYTTDYQPQGRYVLPALVPLCYYVVHGLEKLLLLEPGKLPGFLGRAGRQWAGKHTVPAGSRKKEGIPTAVVITLSALVAFFLLWTVWGYALPYYAANPVAP